MDYSNYSVEELASEDSFINWVNRCDPEAEAFWETFLSQHVEMKLRIEQARILVLNLGKAEARSHSERRVEGLWQEIDRKITRYEMASSREPERIHHFHTYAVAAALGLIVICAGAWYALRPVSEHGVEAGLQQVVSESDFVEEVNTSANVLRLHLSDGTVVSLESMSKLKYRRGYSGMPFREVFLTGEAFFEVAKNPGQPFLVHADQVVTRVLGTSFRVKASDDNKEVVVSVRTGKVSVYALSEGEGDEESRKNGVILLPNQQVTYLRDQDSFGKSLVAQPEILLPNVRESDFIFENTPIREVFKVLQKAYGVEIIFDEEVMSSCFITAPLGSEPLFEKLKIICRTIGARYEIIDARVVITSTGC